MSTSPIILLVPWINFALEIREARWLDSRNILVRFSMPTEVDPGYLSSSVPVRRVLQEDSYSWRIELARACWIPEELEIMIRKGLRDGTLEEDVMLRLPCIVHRKRLRKHKDLAPMDLMEGS